MSTVTTQRELAAEHGDGVYKWSNNNDDYGFELRSGIQTTTQMIKSCGVFDCADGAGCASTLLASLGGGAENHKPRRICLVIDADLSTFWIAKIQSHLEWCKIEGHVQDFCMMKLKVSSTAAKSLDQVYSVIRAAEKFSLRRRDLFLAVGSAFVTEIVGFAAGIYRRATPWICVFTDRDGAMRWAEHDFQLSISYSTNQSIAHPSEAMIERLGPLRIVHPPTAAFLDLAIFEHELGLPQDIFATEDHQHVVSEKVRYHVAAVSDLFKPSNRLLVDDYCKTSSALLPKKKVLVVIEAHLGINIYRLVDNYFRHYATEFEAFRILSSHVSSHDKDMVSAQRVLDAATGMGMSSSDLFVVIGGGTIMDVVGFTAAMYLGGTPYLRIPTTLVGMIDAGIGVKVGVNFDTHKNFIGRYYAPIACLNDAALFLPTLSKNEYACGLAEALKMACITSPRLFEVIESNQQDLALNPYSHEVILLAIRTMLEELQPNIYEHSLIRLVDFGHEFGHIIESLAQFLIPHGECVAMGMAISSYLAYLKGILSRQGLERILDCTLSLDLPIWSEQNKCCDPIILWHKISTEGIEHKDGKLYLAIPRSVGQGGFIDDIVDIDADMLKQTIGGLQHYSTYHIIPFDPATDTTWTKASTVASTGSASTSPPAGSTLQSVVGSRLTSHSQESLSRWDEGDCSSLVAAVIGASGDIGSSLVQYLLDHGAKVICTIRPHPHEALHVARERIRTPDHPNLRVLVGYPLDPSILRTIVMDCNVIYNMAAVVSLSSASADQARVIGLNGFGQGIISWMLKTFNREEQVKVVYPSSQRVHLTLGHQDIGDWVAAAGDAFHKWSCAILEPAIANTHDDQQVTGGFDMGSALETLASDFLTTNPVPPSTLNIYELSKRLGEHLVSLAPRYVLARISGVYGPTFTRGFAFRAAKPKNKKSVEAVEVRDFIYVDDLNKILVKSAFSQPPDQGGAAFDAASGEATDLRDVWRMARELTGDGAKVMFKDTEGVKDEPEAIKLDTMFARELLGREFVPFEEGYRQMIDGCVRSSQLKELATFPLQVPQRTGSTLQERNESYRPPDSAVFTMHVGNDGYFRCNAEIQGEDCNANALFDSVQKSLEKWMASLSECERETTSRYLSHSAGLTLRLRPLRRGAELTFQRNSDKDVHAYKAYLDCDPELVNSPSGPIQLSTMDCDNMIGQAGHHLLSFFSRGYRMLLSRWDHESEQHDAVVWKKFLQPWATPPVMVLDVGSTSLRSAVFGPGGRLLDEPKRVPSPSRHSSPHASCAELQIGLVNAIAKEVQTLGSSHNLAELHHVAIGLGAVVSRQGIVHDASIFWGESGVPYDLRAALTARLPGLEITIINDVSAAAWRYHDSQRFCLITASSGLANKVFDKSTMSNNSTADIVDLGNGDEPDALMLGLDGVGGEMGHVVVEPRLVDELVLYARNEASRCVEEFNRSCLSANDAITAQALGQAALADDAFTLRLLRDKSVPCCACGTLADLCSYSSGRAVLGRVRQLMAARPAGNDVNVDLSTITDSWLQNAIRQHHPLALQAVDEAAYPLALRILHMAADLGLEKFILVGGFALKTAKQHLLGAIRNHMARLCTYTAFFRGWTEARVRQLVQLGIDDDDDVLIGLGHYVQNVKQGHYRAVVKPIGQNTVSIETKELPTVGAKQVLARVLYAGICSTDLQILRGDRGLEPGVLGHEGVCMVLEVGSQVKGLARGQTIVLLPNNPLDDSEKLGHNREGLLQEYVKFGQELIDRGQVLPFPSGVSASPTMTLIEPLSCVVAALELITMPRVSQKNVLVVGAGTLGLLFATMSNRLRARNVFVASRSAESLDFVVAKNIVPRRNTFAMPSHDAVQWSDSIKAITSGQGIDTVIICVSLGQGAEVAQNALTFVNNGGFVHLFGGFESKDVLRLTPGDSKPIWPVRAEWKTETLRLERPNGMETVTISGNRGSRHHHVKTALSLLQQDKPAFSKVLSHVVSLRVVPDVLAEMSSTGKLCGGVAKRVIVDMNDRRAGVARGLQDLSFELLNNGATYRDRSDVAPGNMFRDHASDGEKLVLGWVTPPSWQQVDRSIQEMLQIGAVSKGYRHCIFVGTGPWAFWIDHLIGAMPQSDNNSEPQFHGLCSLDSQALVDVLEAISGDFDKTLVIGTTQSGTTTETIALMSTLRERFDHEGLDYRSHFVWLTDRLSSVADSNSGEFLIRNNKDQDWSGVDVIPLTVQDQGPINALLCVPHSSIVFLSLALRLRPIDPVVRLKEIHEEFSRHSKAVVSSFLSDNFWAIASASIANLHVSLPDCVRATFGSNCLVTQLLQQALSCKDSKFHPRVRVSHASTTRENTTSFPGFIALSPPQIPPSTSPIAAMLLTMNALNYLCAMIAAHHGINFVTHPSVNLYKKRAKHLLTQSEGLATIHSPPAAPPGTASNDEADLCKLIVLTTLATLDKNTQTKFLDIVPYGKTQQRVAQIVATSIKEKWLGSNSSSSTSIREHQQHHTIQVRVIPGEYWNHSEFPSAVASVSAASAVSSSETDDTLRIFVVPRGAQHLITITGISHETLKRNMRLQTAMGLATAQVLSGGDGGCGDRNVLCFYGL